MEHETGRALERFFERWVYNSTLPELSFGYRVEPVGTGQEVVLHFEQAGDVFDVPMTVALRYVDGTVTEVLLPVTDRVVDVRVPLARPLRSAEISRSNAGLADIVKN